MDPRPRIRRPTIGVRLAVLLLVIAGSAAQGRIFESLGRIGRASYESLPGWARAYSSAWVINGGRADVEVWSVSDTLGATLNRLREEAQRQGAIATFFPGSTMAWGVASGGGRVSRFLCNTMDSGRQTMVFRFSQTESAIRASAGGPKDMRLPEDIPAIPGAKAEFLAVGGEAGATLAVFTVPGSAPDARAFLGRALQQAGWTPALGQASSPDNGMGFYLRGSSLCGFTAKMSGHDGSCVVTVLHRRLKSGETN
jgi:hypothetical protein